jgi:hypothetical protein
MAMTTVKQIIEKYNVKPSTREDKKYMVETSDGRTVHFGQPGARIALGGQKQKSYCARSAEIKTEKDSPNFWSRRMWDCK